MTSIVLSDIFPDRRCPPATAGTGELAPLVKSRAGGRFVVSDEAGTRTPAHSRHA